MKIKHIHSELSSFSGNVFFLINNQLASINVCTPNFNDYNEWRLREFRINKEPFISNTDDLTPYIISDYEIDEDELKFLMETFRDDMEAKPEESSLWNYMDSDELMTSVHFEDGFKHFIHKAGSWDKKLDRFESEWTLLKDIPRAKFYEPYGLCYFLASLNEQIDKNYYNEIDQNSSSSENSEETL